MSIVCHSFLIVKFHDHRGLCGLLDHWDFIRWLQYQVMFRVNSVNAWSVIQGEKVRAGSWTAWFSFSSFLVFSWCDMSLYRLWMIFGRSGWLALHITSRNVKASSLRFHYFALIFSQFNIFERYGQILCHISDGFHFMVYWHMDLCRLRVTHSILLNSMITVARVVSWPIGISLGGYCIKWCSE